MSRKSCILFFMFLSVLFSTGIILITGQTQQSQPSPSQIRPFTDLTLEISLLERRLMPLQPIPLVIKQSNNTNQSVLGYKSIGFFAPLDLYVQRNGNAQRVKIDQLTLIRGYYAFKNVEIKSGESSEAKEWITLELNKYFPEAGTYELQAVLFNADRTQSIESNTVIIEIQEPSGVNRNAYNLIKNSSFQNYLFSGAEFNKVKNTLETITTRFPDSAYAKNSFFLSGEIYFHRKQYPKALVNLLRLENDNSFIFADKVKNYLTEIRRLPKEQLNEEKSPE